MNSLSEGPLVAEILEPRGRPQVIIDVLPDDVFLEIFDLYMQEARYNPFAWYTLVHVCRRWRSVVFESSLRLDLRLLCTEKTPVREMLDIWPPLPIVIESDGSIPDADNIVASLKHNDRICQVSLYKAHNLLLEKILAALMQESFPVLTALLIESSFDTDESHSETDGSHSEMDVFVPPGPFSGGSAPLLQHFELCRVPFPELPNFLSSSANHLTHLYLRFIPHSGYIPPEAMVTCISALIGLEELHVGFESPHFLPDWASRRPPSLTRSVQPALIDFSYRGSGEYLEDFVARIDVPQLRHLFIGFEEAIFDASQLVQFVYREASSPKAPDEAHLAIDCTSRSPSFDFSFLSHSEETPLSVKIRCEGSGWEFSNVLQFCTSFSRSLSLVESLRINIHCPGTYQRVIENAGQEWLDFLRPFTDVTTIYLCKTSADQIALVLLELVDGRLTEVLPILQKIHLVARRPSGHIHEGIRQFAAARELSGHPVAVLHRPGW